jgi:uncharacterized protein (DUF58 family)
MPTARGYCVAVASVLFLVGGFGLGYPEMVALGIAASLACVVAAVSMRGASGLRFERLLESARVTRGATVRALLAVTNESDQTFVGGQVRDRLHRRSTDPLTRDPAEDGLGAVASLGRIAPGGQITTSYVLPADRRGVFVLGPLTLTRRDPFGLAQTEQRQHDTTLFVVYPKVFALETDPNGSRHVAPSRTADAAMNANVAFDRLREYVVGDDLRRVHWRTSARTGILMLRETTDEVVDGIVILIDDSLSVGAASPSGTDQPFSPEQLDRYESVLEIAASLASWAAESGQICSVITTSGLRATQRARGGNDGSVLDLLANAVPSTRGLRDAVAELRGLRSGGRMFIVSVRRSAEDRPDVVACATELSRRYRSMRLIEVGEDVGPTQDRELAIWGVRDGAAFASLWPVLESQ